MVSVVCCTMQSHKCVDGALHMQGDPGDLFYIIKEGEAVVYQSSAQGNRKVNHLFKADFFGERALLCDEPRQVLRCITPCNFTSGIALLSSLLLGISI